MPWAQVGFFNTIRICTILYLSQNPRQPWKFRRQIQTLNLTIPLDKSLCFRNVAKSVPMVCYNGQGSAFAVHHQLPGGQSLLFQNIFQMISQVKVKKISKGKVQNCRNYIIIIKYIYTHSKSQMNKRCCLPPKAFSIPSWLTYGT